MNTSTNAKDASASLRRNSNKGGDSTLSMVTPSARKAARLKEPDDIAKRISSEYESGEDENPPDSDENHDENDDEEEEMDADDDFEPSNFPSTMPKWENPLKVSEEAFTANPEALGIPGIDKYSTYEEYERYIDSRIGFHTELQKVTQMATNKAVSASNASVDSNAMATIIESGNTTIMANAKVYYLQGDGMGHTQCKKLKEFVERERKAQRKIDRKVYIDPAAQRSITFAFTAANMITVDDEWHQWDDEKFFKALLKVFPKGSASSASTSREDKCRNLHINVDFKDSSCVNTYAARVTEAEELKVPGSDDQGVVKLLLAGLTAKTSKDGILRSASAVNTRLKERIVQEGEPRTVNDYMVRMYREYAYLGNCYNECRKMGLIPFKDSTKFNELNVISRGAHNPKKRPREEGSYSNSRPSNTCNACGKANHHWRDCLGKNHPDSNPDEHVAWKDSKQGKAWAAKGRAVLSMSHLLNGQRWKDAPDLKNLAKKGEILLNIDSDGVYLPECRIFNHNDSILTVATLLDSVPCRLTT